MKDSKIIHFVCQKKGPPSDRALELISLAIEKARARWLNENTGWKLAPMDLDYHLHDNNMIFQCKAVKLTYIVSRDCRSCTACVMVEQADSAQCSNMPANVSFAWNNAGIPMCRWISKIDHFKPCPVWQGPIDQKEQAQRKQRVNEYIARLATQKGGDCYAYERVNRADEK